VDDKNASPFIYPLDFGCLQFGIVMNNTAITTLMGFPGSDDDKELASQYRKFKRGEFDP